MKRKAIALIIIIGVLVMVFLIGKGCLNGGYELVLVKKEETGEGDRPEEVSKTQSENFTGATVSGSFSVCVRKVIPDYCFDEVTPNVAVVTEFQSQPFTIFVGEKIGSQLKNDEIYVFTIKPITVDYSKEYLAGLNLSSLVWELPGFEIVDFRLANENETGTDSIHLTIENGKREKNSDAILEDRVISYKNYDTLGLE